MNLLLSKEYTKLLWTVYGGALTDSKEMRQWYFDISSFKPEAGFEFQFRGQGEGQSYLHVCKVTEVIPQKKIAYTWKYEGYEGDSKVSFELFPEGTGTRLKLTHEGLETFPVNKKDFAKESFSQGWTQLIGTLLKNFVDGAQ